MVDHFRVVSNSPGFFSRFGDSVKGIFIGLVFFALAFPLLWWGEHRKNEAEFVDEAQAINSETDPALASGTLVKTTGRIGTDEAINDDDYLATDGAPRYLSLKRSVEMYSWKENKKTEKEGDKEVTTYDYVKAWDSSPEDSGKFYDGQGHLNPPLSESERAFQVSDATIGMIQMQAATAEFYGMKDLPVTEEMLLKEEGLTVGGGKIYRPFSEGAKRDPMKTPQVGDVRLSYSAYFADQNGAVVGRWDGTKLVPHVYDGNETFFGVFPGTLEEFRAELNSQYKMLLWAVRIGAFLMLWIGLNLILGPVLMLMDSIPILGSVTRIAVTGITFGLAFILWGLTIILANLWLVLLLGVAIMVGIFFYAKRKGAMVPDASAAAPAA